MLFPNTMLGWAKELPINLSESKLQEFKEYKEEALEFLDSLIIPAKSLLEQYGRQENSPMRTEGLCIGKNYIVEAGFVRHIAYLEPRPVQATTIMYNSHAKVKGSLITELSEFYEDIPQRQQFNILDVRGDEVLQKHLKSFKTLQDYLREQNI